MRWNGTDITGVPTFIYHDELLFQTGVLTDINAPGRLVCVFPTETTVTWERVDGSSISSSTRDRDEFFQRRQTSAPPSVSRLTTTQHFSRTTPLTDSRFNGLWTCRANAVPADRLHVGLYARAEGEPNYSRLHYLWPLQSENCRALSKHCSGIENLQCLSALWMCKSAASTTGCCPTQLGSSYTTLC